MQDKQSRSHGECCASWSFVSLQVHFAFHNLPVEQMKPQVTNASLGVRSLGPCNRAYDISDYLRSPLSFRNVFRTWDVAGHVADLVEPVEEDQFDPWKAGVLGM